MLRGSDKRLGDRLDKTFGMGRSDAAAQMNGNRTGAFAEGCAAAWGRESGGGTFAVLSFQVADADQISQGLAIANVGNSDCWELARAGLQNF